MGLGFSVTNDNGYVQVIDTAPIISHKDTYTVITDNTDYGYIGYKVIYAYKPSDGSQLLTSSFNWRYDSTGSRINRILGQGEIVRFNDGAAPLGGEHFGLEVYNDKGELQFSSNQKPLKVLDVYYANDIRQDVKVINGRRTYWSKNYGDKEVAAIIVVAASWTENPNFMVVAPAKRGNVFAFEPAVEHTDRVAIEMGGITPHWRFHALIIDVTGY